MIKEENSEETYESESYESENEEMDLHSILESFFIEPKKNRNIVDILCELKRGFETHNRILSAMYELMRTHLDKTTEPIQQKPTESS